MFKKFLTVREDGTTDWDSDALQRHALLVMQVNAVPSDGSRLEVQVHLVRLG